MLISFRARNITGSHSKLEECAVRRKKTQLGLLKDTKKNGLKNTGIYEGLKDILHSTKTHTQAEVLSAQA